MPQTAPNTFRNSLENPKKITITYELVPGRGSGGKLLERILRLAKSAKEGIGGKEYQG